MPAKAPAKTAQKPVRKTAVKAPKKVTCGEIQAYFKELQQGNKELQKSQDEAWKAIRETQQAVKETRKNIGRLNNTLGFLVEHILTPGLPRKFKKLGLTFNRTATKNYALKKGLFVIEPSRGEPSPLCGSVEYTGEDVKATKPETEPGVW